MSSLQARLILAFAAVALVSVAAVAAMSGAAVRSQFDRYFFSVPAPEPGPGIPPGPMSPPGRVDPQERLPFGPHMRDSEAMRGMMRRMMGPPEFRFLAQLRRATWRAALAGLLAAVLLGIVVTRYLTAPLRRLASAAEHVGRGDLTQQVPVPADDELGRLARAFNTMTEDLRRLDESRRHLVADIAHELGTPLAILQANLEGMLDGVVETTPDRLAALHTQVRLLARLTHDLRDLSLAQAGRLVLDRRPTDLAAVVAEAVAVTLPHANDKGVTVRTELATSLPPVPADRDRIMQVVHNLLDNAIRHTPSGGSVTVALARAGAEVRLTVSDTGPGIPAGDLERVFERFYRLDPSRSRASGGAGLGLAIVKSLVEAHGGRVWAATAEGGGTAVTAALPVAPPEGGQSPDEPDQ